MASNETVRIQKSYSNAAMHLSGHGIKTGHRSREVIVQLIEKFTGIECRDEPDQYVENFVQTQRSRTMATVKPPRPFKDYVPPRNMRLVAAKVADQPVPMSMSSSVIHKFFPS